jgi:hypothetical protein
MGENQSASHDEVVKMIDGKESLDVRVSAAYHTRV